MSPPAERFEVQPGRVLVVSEDPSFIESMRSVAQSIDGKVVACMGPAASRCVLDDHAVCPLVARSEIVLVDPPPSGIFRHHLTEVSADDYAVRLQAAHPHTQVLVRSVK